jgi:single-stranded-DNA-specific exonuclease
VPRINAAGRLDDSGDVVRLLLSDSEEEAAELSSWLDRVNAERQRIEEAVYQEARESIAAGDTDSVVMLSGRGWHQGVLGIVASKIADAYCLPTFVFSIESGIAKGSARSIPSFDICRGLAECEDLLLSFGGHKQAAGVKLKVEDLAAFQDRMRGLIKRDLAGADNVPTIEIDAQVAFPMLNSALLKEIEMLEPFGHGNPEPLLGSRDLDVVGPRLVGNNHLKMKLKQGQASFDAIGFDMGNLIKILDHAARFDAAFTLTLNEWNGGRYLQLVLKAFRPSLP